MSDPTWQTSWDDELQDLLREVAASESSETYLQSGRAAIRSIRRQSRKLLDMLGTVDPANLDSRHRAEYWDQVRTGLWINLLTEPVVQRKIWESVRRRGRRLSPNEVSAAILRLLRMKANPKVRGAKAKKAASPGKRSPRTRRKG